MPEAYLLLPVRTYGLKTVIDRIDFSMMAQIDIGTASGVASLQLSNIAQRNQKFFCRCHFRSFCDDGVGLESNEMIVVRCLWCGRTFQKSHSIFYHLTKHGAYALIRHVYTLFGIKNVDIGQGVVDTPTSGTTW